MKFRTEHPIEKASFCISHPGPLLSLGSCFAQNMAGYLARYRYNVCANPCGVVYNPASILSLLQMALGQDSFGDEMILPHEGVWHSMMHSSLFSAKEKQECYDRSAAAIEELSAALQRSRCLIITYGTAWVYEHKTLKRVVANCHKLPAGDFLRKRLTVQEVIGITGKIIQVCRAHNRDLKMIFTVSPVRHLKDGFHGNQLSKATLLLGLEAALQDMESCAYFPAYEILLDDLRDYRFYAGDLAHPSGQATEYIWEKFRDSFLYKDEALLKELEQIEKALAHRPLVQESPAQQRFKENTIQKMEELEMRYSQLNFSREKNDLLHS